MAKQWQLTLMARSAGNIKIPSISFGKDKSPSLALVVQQATSAPAGQANDPIIVETELSPKNAYVQSQLIYTVRLLHALSLNKGELTEPEISGVEAIIQKLGDDRNYLVQHVRDGSLFRALQMLFDERKVKHPRMKSHFRMAEDYFRSIEAYQQNISHIYDISPPQGGFPV